MNSVLNFSLRTKLALSFGAAFALIIAVGLIGVLQLRAVSSTVIDLRDGSLPRFERLSEVKRSTAQFRSLTGRQTETTDYRQLAEINRSTKTAERSIGEALGSYRKLALSGEEQATISDFAALWQKYDSTRSSALARLELGEKAAAIRELKASADPIFEAAHAKLDELLLLAKEGSEQAVLRAQQRYDDALRLTVMIALLAACGAWVGVVWVTRTISRPLLWVSDAMSRLARGDLSATIESSHRRDEIGALFSAARSYRDSLERILDLSARSDTERQRFEAALSNMSQGLYMVDSERRLIVCNRRFADTYALPPRLTAPGVSLEDIEAYRRSAGSAPLVPEALEQDQPLGSTIGAANPRKEVLQDGRTMRISHQPLAEGGWVATHEDISDSVRAEALIAHMAHHDALTGLANRVRFREEMDRALTRARRGELVAVHCLDLDRFKSVNDTLGHPIGDALLKEVAERLAGCVREMDTIARLGGDEFAIVQVDMERPEQAIVLANGVIESVSAPYVLDGHHVVIGTSVGISLAPNDGHAPDHLLKNADMALYRAKTDGRGTYRFFEPEMDTRLQARRVLETELRRALVAGEFELAYQPLIRARDGEINGFEALVLWRHPERGILSPSEFIPVAEETGLIIPLGEWVLRRACDDAAKWPKHMRVAVNLSRLQVKNRNLIPTVESVLASSQLSASRLELEIAESTLLQSADEAYGTLRDLHALGVRVSLDNFGAERSSFSQLLKFSFNKIKIDRSLICGASNDSSCNAIVQAVADLGRRLGVETAASGVETEVQLEQVRAGGCTEVQGIFLSPPKPADQLAPMLVMAASRL